jgi:osmotically-inducible protein OsmY
MPLTLRAGALAAVLAAATMLTTACSATPPRPPANAGTDEALAGSVYAALAADPTYFYRHVDVRVDNGVTDLSGLVWSTAAIYRARQIARDVPGVRQVVTSHLMLEREGRTNGTTR